MRDALCFSIGLQVGASFGVQLLVGQQKPELIPLDVTAQQTGYGKKWVHLRVSDYQSDKLLHIFQDLEAT